MNDQDQAAPFGWGGLAWRAGVVVIIVAVISGFLVLVHGTGTTDGTDGSAAAEREKAAAVPATIATALGPSIDVFDHAGGRPRTYLLNPNRQGAPLTLLVQEKRADWVRVLLPVRPNGRTGWVKRSEVHLSTTDYRIDVSLRHHRMTLHKGARTVLSAPAATGASGTPTPTGKFFVTVLLRTPNPNGEYGPYAFGLSAFSSVLFHFGGGPGQVGLHGTNDPSSLGRSVSSGCVRVSDATVSRLAKIVPLGVPVTIGT